jgi:hypothetical protein
MNQRVLGGQDVLGRVGRRASKIAVVGSLGRRLRRHPEGRRDELHPDHDRSLPQDLADGGEVTLVSLTPAARGFEIPGRMTRYPGGTAAPTSSRLDAVVAGHGPDRLAGEAGQLDDVLLRHPRTQRVDDDRLDRGTYLRERRADSLVLVAGLTQLEARIVSHAHSFA